MGAVYSWIYLVDTDTHIFGPSLNSHAEIRTNFPNILKEISINRLCEIEWEEKNGLWVKECYYCKSANYRCEEISRIVLKKWPTRKHLRAWLSEQLEHYLTTITDSQVENVSFSPIFNALNSWPGSTTELCQKHFPRLNKKGRLLAGQHWSWWLSKESLQSIFDTLFEPCDLYYVLNYWPNLSKTQIISSYKKLNPLYKIIAINSQRRLPRIKRLKKKLIKEIFAVDEFTFITNITYTWKWKEFDEFIEQFVDFTIKLQNWSLLTDFYRFNSSKISPETKNRILNLLAGHNFYTAILHTNINDLPCEFLLRNLVKLSNEELLSFLWTKIDLFIKNVEELITFLPPNSLAYLLGHTAISRKLKTEIFLNEHLTVQQRYKIGQTHRFVDETRQKALSLLEKTDNITFKAAKVSWPPSIA